VAEEAVDLVVVASAVEVLEVAVSAALAVEAAVVAARVEAGNIF
jgi:hypothetical protein